MEEHKTIFLAKFGKKEHLEMLANGIVYFNPISKYRHDTTNFRGDVNEGVVPIDPLSLKIFNKEGENIFDRIPKPTSVGQTYQGDDTLLMFCGSMITECILQKNQDCRVFTDEYKTAIKDFGDYTLLFELAGFTKLIKEAQNKSTPRFGYKSGPIIYRDLSDFSKNGNYSTAYNITKSKLDRYFVKSNKYMQQNEWRLIIVGLDEALPTNKDGSYTINIGKMDWQYLVDTKTFLHTFQISEDK